MCPYYLFLFMYDDFSIFLLLICILEAVMRTFLLICRIQSNTHISAIWELHSVSLWDFSISTQILLVLDPLTQTPFHSSPMRCLNLQCTGRASSEHPTTGRRKEPFVKCESSNQHRRTSSFWSISVKLILQRHIKSCYIYRMHASIQISCNGGSTFILNSSLSSYQ